MIMLTIFIAQYFIEDTRWLVIIDNLHWTLGHAAAFSMAWIGLRENQNAQQLAARRSFFIGLSFYLVGQLLWNFQVYTGANTFPALSDIGYLALGPCCLWGFVSFKRLTPTEHGFHVLLLDFIMMSVSILALTLIIYLNKSTADNLIEFSVMIAYPVSLLGTFCFGLLMILHVRPKLNWSWIFFLIGIGSEGLLWMWWNLQALDNKNVDGSLINQLFSVAAVMVGVSAMRWQMVCSSNIQYEKWCEVVLRILPLTGVGIAVSAYLWILSAHDVLPEIQNIVLYICSFVFILAILRQSIMLKERDKLLIAQRSATQSMILLKTIIETIPVRVFWKDLDLNFLGCNTAFAIDAGLKNPSDLIGKNDQHMSWAENAELYRSDDQHVVNTGESKLVYEELQTTPNGEQVWLRTSKVPLKDNDGKPIGILGMYEDITEYKSKEFELHLVAVAFETQEGIMVTDANRLILRVNNAFTKITGYSSKDVIGFKPRILSSGQHDKTFYDQMWHSIRTTGGWEGEVWNRRKSGELYPEYLNITAVKDNSGAVVNYVASLTDITHRKEAVSRIEKLAEELALKDVLVREVHHRIKNNLHTANMLLTSFAENHPEVEELLNQVAMQVQSIAVVHGLQGKLSSANLSLYDLVHEITSEIQILWNKKITLDKLDSWWPCQIIDSEATPLALVINELVTNAIKHSPHEHDIRIVFSGEPETGKVVIEICNIGTLPNGFSTNAREYFNTGLQLITALLPRSGANLSWSTSKEMVITKLVLESPNIHTKEIA
jgi:PAS domain S-box-containing protein